MTQLMESCAECGEVFAPMFGINSMEADIGHDCEAN